MPRAPVAVAFHRGGRLRILGLLGILARVWLVLQDQPRRTRGSLRPISGGAITITPLISTASTVDGTSFVSGAFTPSAGSLLITLVVASGATTGLSVTDSQSLGSRQIATALYNTSGNVVSAWVSQKTAAASSMTVTYNTALATGAVVMVYGVTGLARADTTAIRQVGTIGNNQTSGTIHANFPVNALTTNAYLGVAGNVTSPATLTPPTSWTESAAPLMDTGYATPTTGAQSCYRVNGEVGTAINWGSTSTNWTALTVELDGSTQACVQSQAGRLDASASTLAIVFKSNLVAGHGLVAYGYWGSATITATCSDSTNGAWTACTTGGGPLRGAGAQATLSSQAFYFLNSAGGVAPTVTITFSSAVTDAAFTIEEFAGIGLDPTAGYAYNNFGSGTAPATSTLPAPASAHCFVMAGWIAVTIAGSTLPWTLDEQVTMKGNPVVSETVSSSSALQATFGTTAAQVSMLFIIAFNSDPVGPRRPPTLAAQAVGRGAVW